MIRTATIEHAPGAAVVRHWSDANVKIRQIETETLWNDAVDILPCAYTYEETDEPLDPVEIDDAEALAIITGGAT